jgi:hypothetical protein
MPMNIAAMAWVAVLALTGAGLQEGGAAAPAKSPGSAVSLGAGNVDKLSKMVRKHFGLRDEDLYSKKAKKELDAIVEETGKIGKALKNVDPALALDDWREIVRRGQIVEKPTVNVSWRQSLRLLTFTKEQTDQARAREAMDAKELQGVFDNQLKAFVSVPTDFAKVTYPVVVALHPVTDEVKALKDMRKSKQVVEQVDAWAKATYSEGFLAKAIVVVPVMDLVVRNPDGVSFTRPRWETDDGVKWVLAALSEIVLKNLNSDQRRVFFDGDASASAAVLNLCASFPGFQAGCIVRGAPPGELHFENCVGMPILFVGAEGKALHDEWKGKEGFVLEMKDSVDDATLLQWMADHPKNFAPQKIMLKANRIEFASSNWLSVTEEDRSKEKLPIALEATIDREKNVISINANEKVKSVAISLNDDLVDLSKEVRVVQLRTIQRENGESDTKEIERFKGVLKRSIEDALDWGYRHPYSDVYFANIRVTFN